MSCIRPVINSGVVQAELSGVALLTSVFKISSVVACRCPQAIIRGVVTNILKRWQGYYSDCVEAFISGLVTKCFQVFISGVVTVVFKGSPAVRQQLNCRMASHGYICRGCRYLPNMGGNTYTYMYEGRLTTMEAHKHLRHPHCIQMRQLLKL